MADPFSIAGMTAISMGTTAASGGLGVLGALSSSSSKAGMYQYQAGMADFNAKIARQNADYTLAVGDQNASLQGLKYKQAIGDATAKGGASGVAVGQGSSKDVLDSMSRTAYLDQSIIRGNAARTAYGYEVEAAKDTAQGQIYRGAADDTKSAGKINALSSILGTVSSVSSKWGSASTSGIFA